MDLLKIRSLIEQYRALSEMSSLPFWVAGQGDPVLCWFNYDLEETPEALLASVHGLYTLEGDRPQAHACDLKQELPLSVYTEPTLAEPDYYARLEDLRTGFSAQAMEQLIAMAEPAPLPQLYALAARAVLQMKGV